MYEKFLAENKITYLTVPIHNINSISLMVWVRVGSRYENDKIWGASHFIEHLMFKGTKKRPSTLILSKELDAIGAEYNAFTSKEYTCYYVKLNVKHFEKVCDLSFDMLNNSLFDENEMEREKQVIVEEIKMYFENPLLHIEDLFESVIYDKQSRLGLDVIGSQQSILDMNRKDVLDFLDQGYKSSNIIITIAGAVDENILQTCQKYFDKYSRVGKGELKVSKFKSKQNEPKIKIQYRDTEQIQFMLGFLSKGYGHKDNPGLKLLSIILGGNMSSRLFISIRERLGLCYSIGSSFDTYQDIGSFCIRAGLDKNRIEQAFEAILKEIKLLLKKGVTDEELQRAKDYFEGKLTLKLEDSLELARWYGYQGLMEKGIDTVDEYIKKINNVTKEDILRLAQELFDFSKANIAVIGPIKDENKFLNML